MDIKIEPHTLERAKERGTGMDEIQDVLEYGTEFSARGTEEAKQRFTSSSASVLENTTSTNASKLSMRKKTM